ncbi:hypothetical protein Halar_3701 [halophilic archaeon DL31]|nr:hypothetical protein Halar_3701 [halophilic archaeon DL31]
MNGLSTDQYLRVAGVVIVSTVVLTAVFLGVLAVVTGKAPGLGGRVPVYMLLMAVAFVISVVGLIRCDVGGGVVLSAATGAGVLTFCIGLLAGEGVVFTVREPSAVFGSELVVYFLAAALIGTGLSYWTVNYWREFTNFGEDETEQGSL